MGLEKVGAIVCEKGGQRVCTVQVVCESETDIWYKWEDRLIDRIKMEIQ